jgi:phage tail protein X
MKRRRWGVVGVVVAVALVLSVTIFVVRANTAIASCQPTVSAGIPVATPDAAQQQYASTHNCGVTPRPFHSSTQTVP